MTGEKPSCARAMDWNPGPLPRSSAGPPRVMLREEVAVVFTNRSHGGNCTAVAEWERSRRYDLSVANSPGEFISCVASLACFPYFVFSLSRMLLPSPRLPNQGLYVSPS